jgi:hypothetical protein
MKHIKDLVIKSTIAKIRAYEVLEREAIEQGKQEEAKGLRVMIEQWRLILEDLLKD